MCTREWCAMEFEVTGESDHAGTTPMKMRKKLAFLASINIMTEARQKLKN